MLVEPAKVPNTRRSSVPVLVMSWRTIAGTTTLSQTEAVDAMVKAILAQ